MKQKLLKILAIFLFAVMIYLSGHTSFWLISCITFLDWVAFVPLDDSGQHRVLRGFVTVWAICSGILSYRLTK